MRIEVATQQSESTKDRGDLLETLSEKLLKSQNYEVQKEIRNTGVELDLLCRSKVNKNKQIYVECKAYRDNRKIDSTIVDKMIGIKQRKNYDEAWLISTCPFGKEAKGIVNELIEDQSVNDLYFYTPEKLINALVDSKVIIGEDIAKHEINKTLKKPNLIGEPTLLITSFGDFWVFEYKNGGKKSSVIVSYASNGEIVDDSELLEELSRTDTSLKNLNFNKILQIDNLQTKKDLKLEFNQLYLDRMLDTGVKYTHPNKSNLNLDDLFIYQDLQILNDEKKINSSKFNKIDSDKFRKFVFGDEVSGKTTLAYKLQRTYLETGFIPVYINSTNIKTPNADKIINLVNRSIKKQYKDVTTETLESFDNKKIVLLIDDFHKIKTNKGATVEVLLTINSLYEHIIIFSNSNRELKVLTNNEYSESLSTFDFYKIKELGYKLRDEIIGKWISIGQQETINDTAKYNKIVDTANTINTAVGRNFVPTYPIYVLTLLQSFEATTATSLQGSAYAEFYNYLIIQSLGSTGIKASDLHLYFSFLSELAYYLFNDCSKEISKDDLFKFHEKYCKEKIIRVSFEKIEKVLINSKILHRDNNSYCFNHNYIYYFFVAKYLSENISHDDVREKIELITDRLYLSEFANILIFLVHFSKDEFVLNGIISQAKNVFSGTEIVTFHKDEFANINNLIEQELIIQIEDTTAKESREQELVLRDDIDDIHNTDESEKDIEVDYNEDIKNLDIFGKINLSFKLMEILGQIAKNYYGSLNGSVKIDIINETYNLGLRSLNSLMGDFNKYTDVLEDEILEILEKKDGKDLTGITKKIVFDFASMLSFIFIAKTANSVASRDLSSVFDIVYKDDKHISKRLINMAIDLDFHEGLNVNRIIAFNDELKDNNIASMLLKLLVTRHLYKFNIKHDQKQKLCKKLKIDVKNQIKMLTQNK